MKISDLEILPCPFCGNDPTFYMKIDLFTKYCKPYYYAECQECNHANINDGWGDIEKCIENWNMREQ